MRKPSDISIPLRIRLRRWVFSAPFYVKVLGFGLVMTALFSLAAYMHIQYVSDKMLAHDMRHVTRAILWGLVLCGIAGLSSAFLVVYVLNRRLRGLLEATQRLNQGDFAVRAPVYSNDEIGQLALAFNRMAEDLAESKRQVLRADKLASIGQFAAGLAHEINNPLDGMLSCLARLQRDPVNLAQNMEYLHMMQHGLKRIAMVIQRLLEYSQTQDVHLKQEDIHGVIGNVVVLVETLAHENEVAIELEFVENVPCVMGDKYHLEQAFLNIAINAIAAMPQGGVLTFHTRRVEETGRKKPLVGIDIDDTGAGIGPADLARIFEPFFTTKEPEKGTGLGLAIVKEIIEMHHGTIDVESTEGVGTRFRILLPAAPADATHHSGEEAEDLIV